MVIIVAYKAHNINGVSDSSERCTFYNTSSTGRIQMYYHVWYLSGQVLVSYYICVLYMVRESERYFQVGTKNQTKRSSRPTWMGYQVMNVNEPRKFSVLNMNPTQEFPVSPTQGFPVSCVLGTTSTVVP